MVVTCHFSAFQDPVSGPQDVNVDDVVVGVVVSAQLSMQRRDNNKQKKRSSLKMATSKELGFYKARSAIAVHWL